MTDNLDLDTEEVADVESNPQDKSETKDDSDDKIKRYKEQINGSKAEVERLRKMVLETEIQKASQDANSLLELHKKDPKLANEVAKSFGYADVDEVKKNLNVNNTVEKKDGGLTEDDFERLYQQRKAKEEHEKSLKKAEKLISKLDEDQQEIAKKYFDKISKGQMLDEETAIEFAEMATLYVSKDKLKSEKLNEGLAQLGSTGITKSSKKSTAPTEETYVIRDGKLVLITND